MKLLRSSHHYLLPLTGQPVSQVSQQVQHKASIPPKPTIKNGFVNPFNSLKYLIFEISLGILGVGVGQNPQNPTLPNSQLKRILDLAVLDKFIHLEDN